MAYERLRQAGRARARVLNVHHHVTMASRAHACASLAQSLGHQKGEVVTLVSRGSCRVESGMSQMS